MKKCQIEPTNFTNDFSEFTHKTILTPSTQSFWGALSLSLFQSLNRLKGVTNETIPIWSRLIEKFSKGKDLTNFKKLGKFSELLWVLTEVDKVAGKSIIEDMFGGDIEVVKGMKAIVCGCMENESEGIVNDRVSFDAVMKVVSLELGVHIVCFGENRYRLFRYSELAPLLFLYNKNEDFSVVYHYSAKYIDEKNEVFFVDYKNFPFFYNPNTKFVLKLAKDPETVISKFLEISNLLAYNCKPLSFNARSEFREIIKAIKSICPDFQERLQDLYQKVTSHCGHKAKEYTPVCLQSHCSICLMDSILESNSTQVFCPCNVELSTSDILHLSGQASDPNNTASVANKPQKSAKKPSNTQKLPIIARLASCETCKKQLKPQNFSSVSCKQHLICLDCRAGFLLKNLLQCPICRRGYSEDELTILRMRNKSIDLTSSMLGSETFG